jgi:hypothetical protein
MHVQDVHSRRAPHWSIYASKHVCQLDSVGHCHDSHGWKKCHYNLLCCIWRSLMKCGMVRLSDKRRERIIVQLAGY